jgi:hypothetical protein
MAWNKWAQSEGAWGAGTAVASAVQASLLPAGGPLALAANAFFAAPSPVGSRFKLTAFGLLSTPAGNTGTLDFKLMFGATAVFDMGATGALAASLATAPWSLEIDLSVKTMGQGAGTTFSGVGRLLINGAVALETVVNGGGGFDCTSSQLLDLQLLIGAYEAGDSVQMLGGSWLSDT